MTNDEPSAALPEARSSPIEVRGLPSAWLPLTPRGIAAFSRARLGRLLVVQFLVATLTAGAGVWFLTAAWFPVALQGIRQLPDTGIIAGRQLDSPRDSRLPLAENRFIAFFADTNTATDIVVRSDLRVGFHREEFAFCSILGCLSFRYPEGPAAPFNRLELEPWWGAWEPMFLSLTAVAVVALLFASWLVLATIYSPVAWMVAYFKDRQLTLAGSWKLAAAALLPGALLVALGLALYGLGVLDLTSFLLVWVLHFPAGWLCLYAGVMAVPKVEAVARATPNPFDTSPDTEKPRERNPFAPT